MAVFVIFPFEIIDIKHRHHGTVCVPAEKQQLANQQFRTIAPRIGPRQPIDIHFAVQEFHPLPVEVNQQNQCGNEQEDQDHKNNNNRHAEIQRQIFNRRAQIVFCAGHIFKNGLIQCTF